MILRSLLRAYLFQFCGVSLWRFSHDGSPVLCDVHASLPLPDRNILAGLLFAIERFGLFPQALSPYFWLYFVTIRLD